jgi:hypothetical protein
MYTPFCSGIPTSSTVAREIFEEVHRDFLILCREKSWNQPKYPPIC